MTSRSTITRGTTKKRKGESFSSNLHTAPRPTLPWQLASCHGSGSRCREFTCIQRNNPATDTPDMELERAIPHWPDNASKAIFTYLPFEEQKRLRIVCKKWNEIIQKIHPKLRLQVWITNINYQDELAKLSNNPHCRQIDFISFTKPLQEALLPAFGRIQTIGFHGIITYYDMICALFYSPGLETLYFEDVEFSGEKIISDFSYIKLANLKEIVIKCSWLSRVSTSSLSSDEEKLLDFLVRLDYGALRTFKCYCSNTILDSLDKTPLFIEAAKTTPNLFKFILKHKSTLVNITLGDPTQPLLLMLANNINDSTNQKPLQLESISGIYDIPLSFDIMFMVQYNLRTLKINNAIPLLPLINLAISHCFESITTIHLAGNGRFGLYDLNTISSCNNLQHLSLHFTECLLSPFPKLSNKLMTLSLSGPITHATLLQITAVQVNLETLVLEDNLPMKEFPDVIVADIDMDLIERFMRLPVLTTLSFTRCVIYDRETIAKWCKQYDNIRAFNLLKKNQQRPEGLLIERYFS